MCTHLYRVVERWAQTHRLPAEFLASLEQDAPWVFCGDGMSEELAFELLGDVFSRFNLGEVEARAFARLLNAHTEFEAPSEVPERLAVSEKLEALLGRWHRTGQAGGIAMWLSENSTASFKPTVHVHSGVLPPQQLIVELKAVAAECPYYDQLAFVGPSNEELAVVGLRANDG